MVEPERVEEVAEVAPEVLTPEPEEAPSPEPKTPTLKETPEFREALREAQSGWDRKIASMKAETSQAKLDAADAKASSESAKAELQALQAEHDEAMSRFLGDDPDAKQSYLDKKKIDEARRQVTKKEAEADRKLYEAERLVWSVNMARKAQALSTETGIPMEDLEACHTEEAMEVKALRYQMKQKAEQPKPPATPTPKVDSGISTGKGGKLTAEQAEKLTPEEYAEEPSVKARFK